MSGTATRIQPLPARAATPAAIAPYGTLVEPGEDGTPFGQADAVLDLGRGTPRLYIMRLTHRPMRVTDITCHAAVTQCLASTRGEEWFIALATPGDADDAAAMPDPAGIEAFRIPGGTALALHRGTWHAGPFFTAPTMDFLNLELADTNTADHRTVRLDREFGLAFDILP
jgi:ureidoglycolate lyase